MLEANDHLITPYPHELRHATFKLLRREQVEILLDTKLVDFNGQTVTLGDGRQIATYTLIWTAGIKAAPMLIRLISGGQAQDESKSLHIAAASTF